MSPLPLLPPLITEPEERYGLRNLSYHLYHGGRHTQLFQVLQDGFLDFKLARTGDPALLIDDYEYAFRAAREIGDIASLVPIGLHRTLLSSQAELLTKDEVLDVIQQLACSEGFRGWLSWCSGLSHLISEPPKVILVLAHFSHCCADAELGLLANRMREHAKGLKLDVFEVILIKKALEVLVARGRLGIELCLEILDPWLVMANLVTLRLGLSQVVATVAKALQELRPTEAMPLLTRILTKCQSLEKEGREAVCIEIARALLHFDRKEDAIILLEPLLSPAVSDDGWSQQIEAARVLYSAGNEDLRARARGVLQKTVDEIRCRRTPFSAGQVLVEIARVRSEAREPPESVVEALNEALIAACRISEDWRGSMGPEPSARCQALATLAEAAFDLGWPTLVERCLERADRGAVGNPRVGQRVVERCRIAQAWAYAGRESSAIAVLRLAIWEIPQIEDFNPHVRRGLEQDDAISRAIDCCSNLARLPGVSEVLCELLALTGKVSYRDNRIQFRRRLMEAALQLDELSQARRILDLGLESLAVEILPTEKKVLLRSLAERCRDAPGEVRELVAARLRDELSPVATPELFEAVAPRLAQVRAEFGDTDEADELLEEIWRRGTERKSRELLIAYMTAAKRSNRYHLCERALAFLFEHPVNAGNPDQAELCELGAKVYVAAGNSEGAEALLCQAEIYASADEDLSRRAEQQARLARQWLDLDQESRAVNGLEAAIAAMREWGNRSHGRNSFMAIATTCGRLGRSSHCVDLLTKATEVALSSASTLTLGGELPVLARASESVQERGWAIHYLERLRELAEKILEREAFAWMRVQALGPLLVSLAVVHYRSGEEPKARRNMEAAITLALELLRAEAPSNREFFAQTVLSDCCRACAVLSDWPASREFLHRIEAAASLFGGRRMAGPLPEMDRLQLEASLAEALLSFGEREKAANILHQGVGAITAGFSAGTLLSEAVRFYPGLLLAAEGRFPEDVLTLITEPKYFQEACERLCEPAESLPEQEMLRAFQNAVQAASRFGALLYARVVLRFLAPLAKYRPQPEILHITDRILREATIHSPSHSARDR